MKWTLGYNLYSTEALMFNAFDYNDSEISSELKSKKYQIYIITKRKKIFFDRCQEMQNYNISWFYILNAVIRIAKYPSNKMSFLYNVVTDSTGHFSFKGLDFKENSYELFFTDTIAGTIYSVGDTITEETVNLILVASPQISRRGISFTVTDSTGTGTIPGAELCLFTSSVIAAGDTCVGSTYHLKTDPHGYAFITDIPSHLYYVLAKFNNSKVKLRAYDTVSVGEGIRLKTIRLKR